MKMSIIKICMSDPLIFFSPEGEKLKEAIVENAERVDIISLNNQPYFQWLKGLKSMPWLSVWDVYVKLDGKEAVEYAKSVSEKLKILAADRNGIDTYIVEQETYKEPVNRAEVITSCYFWNYENDKALREEKMAEHFVMEQAQRYYDYVVFQKVIETITKDSPHYDFFFESHVSDPNGINEIYSKPALGNMREHSKFFLNVDSRLLSFGHVEILK